MKAYIRLIYCNILQILREPITIIVYLGFPIVFVLLFGMAFSKQDQSLSVGIVENNTAPSIVKAFNMKEVKEVLNINYGTLEEQLEKLDNNELDFVLQGEIVEGIEKAEVFYRSEENLSLIQMLLNNMYYSQLEVQQPNFIYTNVEGTTDTNPLDSVLPGVLAITLMQIGLFGALNLSKLKENKTLRAYGVTPVSKHTIIICELIVRLFVCLVQGLIVIGLGSLIFDLNVSYSNFHIIVFWILLGGSTFIALGYTFVAFFNSTEATNGVIQITQLGLMFLSGVFVPITILPEFTQKIIYCNPVFYLADALSSSITNTKSEMGFMTNFSILFSILIISTIISTRIKWD